MNLFTIKDCWPEGEERDFIWEVRVSSWERRVVISVERSERERVSSESGPDSRSEGEEVRSYFVERR